MLAKGWPSAARMPRAPEQAPAAEPVQNNRQTSKRLRLKLRKDWNLTLYQRSAMTAPAQLATEQQDAAHAAGADHQSNVRTAQAGELSPMAGAAPVSPRQLFPGLLRFGSPHVRRAFIPKVASTTRWRPRLAYRLLPKFLHVLDGPCTSFLLRHLVKLQPAACSALEAHLPSTPADVLHHVLCYVHQPCVVQSSQPTVYRAPWLWRKRGTNAARQPQGSVSNAERAEFQLLVLAVCARTAPKLHTFSGGKLSDIVAALGDLHVQPQQEFWTAWEAATLPLMQQMVDSGTATEQRVAHVAARNGVAGLRQGLRHSHLAGMLAGVARCRHTPSSAWQAHLWAAMRSGLCSGQLQPMDVAVMCEGWALACLHRSLKPGAERCWQLPDNLLQALCTSAQQQLKHVQWRGGTPAGRLMLAPMLAMAAHVHMSSFCEASHTLRDVYFPTFCTWWLEFSQSFLTTKIFEARALAAGVWTVARVVEPTAQHAGPVARPSSIDKWLDTAACALLKPGPQQSASTVHATLAALHMTQHKPPRAILCAALNAVRSTLPDMTPQQLIDVLRALSTCNMVPAPSWGASIAVYLYGHLEHFDPGQLQALKEAASNLHIRLPATPRFMASA